MLIKEEIILPELDRATVTNLKKISTFPPVLSCRHTITLVVNELRGNNQEESEGKASEVVETR